MLNRSHAKGHKVTAWAVRTIRVLTTRMSRTAHVLCQPVLYPCVMTFRTITAKYAGKCKRCQGAIVPGSKIRFGGRGMTYHLAAQCPGSEAFTGIAGDAPPFVAADRAAFAAGISVARNGAGEVIGYRNRAGRCEDAPCCGCCS